MNFQSVGILYEEFIMIMLSIVIGLAIGAEREYRGKSAGLRTFILVSFGSCIFTILSIKIGVQSYDRIAANIITGIGFLGAGVIFKEDNKVGGITTATTIWATASLGMCTGSNHLYLALLGTIIVLVVLAFLYPLQKVIDDRNRVRTYKVSTARIEDIAYCEMLFKQYSLRFTLEGQKKTDESLSTNWAVSGRRSKHDELVNQLLTDARILAFQF
ncbi:magnesium transporter MgtC [Taibaiella sp. KBW10]|uniref:MgtC/SapB family protein n=1 Tax=Taibaiella sp. KBW10 TaxID=2153357 RepID=UPI000F595E64|nr:MgtC/SapB family protein [Taibaiella sp. KBW10]RQO32527.1 magnesium transporter MgtC [Taibaiella sp. KBW10]